MAPDATAWYAVILLAVGAVFWTWRSGTRQIESTRDLAEKLNSTGARVLAAASRREISELLEQDLAAALGPVKWKLFFYERARRTLESGREVVEIHAPAEGEPAAVALAFRHRKPSRLRTPGSTITTHILPCQLGDEAHAVLVIGGAGLADADEGTLRYLANQLGAAIGHLDHLAGREVDARAERRQAVSQVMTRIIAEIEQGAAAPELAGRLRTMMREEDRIIAAAQGPAEAGAVRTTLLLEPDPKQRRAFLAALAERGIRALPASTVDEAADRLERIAFDLVFCAASLAESGWLEIASRLGRRSRLVWLADDSSLRWIDGSGLTVLRGPEDLDAVVK